VRPSFQDQWFAVVLFGASALAVYHGLRIAVRREIDNPFLQARGGKALAIALALVALGVAGAAMAVMEGLHARG
jgi:hypothetical protein